MNNQIPLQERAIREAAAVDLNWILITAGLALLSLLTACGKMDVTAKGGPGLEGLAISAPAAPAQAAAAL